MPAAQEETPLIGAEASTPDDHPLLWFVFNGVRLVAIAISLAMMVAQVLTLMVLDEGLFQCILRVYMLSFCVCFCLAELNLFQTQIPFLAGWIHRGIMYSFVGVIGVEEANTVKISKNNRTHKVKETFVGKMSGTYVWIVSVSMFAVGLVYMCMGAMCLRKVYNRMNNIINGNSNGRSTTTTTTSGGADAA